VSTSQPYLPDVIYCAAGGCQTQCGFLIDIDANNLDSCMKNNYYMAAYASQIVLKLWKEHDIMKEGNAVFTHRRIVFINSAGAFVGLPGYTAYTHK
jgi:3-dehydrosphinganine reductase